jgi:hypothetical protein
MSNPNRRKFAELAVTFPENLPVAWVPMGYKTNESPRTTGSP